MGDALAEFSGWDGKLANTLRALLLKPGELTEQWIEGRRVHFIAPLRLYLTTSFLFFLVTAGAPNLRPTGNAVDLPGIQINPDSKPGQAAKGVGLAIDTKKPLTGPQRDSALAAIAKAPAVLRPFLRNAVNNPSGMVADIKTAMPKVFFVLVPVFALVLALFYHGRTYPEHLYFAIHYFAFFFVARGIGNLALYTRSTVFAGLVNAAMILWIIGYTYLALRRVYAGSTGATIAKGIGIFLLYAVTAALVLLVGAVIAGS
jgi:hypothetical protein